MIVAPLGGRNEQNSETEAAQSPIGKAAEEFRGETVTQRAGPA
jgi:hypothetical protein